MQFKSKNLLITGGAGFIGSNFINFIIENFEKINIINLDLLTYASNLDNLRNLENNARYKFIKGDICDSKLVENIFSKYKIDGLINFAAETHVDNSITNPDVFIKTNINGVFNLLNIAYKFWHEKPFKVKKEYSLARFHQISTDEVFGSIEDGSFSERSNYNPNSPYSASKASADMLVRSFNKTYGLNTVISVSSNNFGFGQNNEKFIPSIINSIMLKKPIRIYGDGNNIRNWIYVLDNCEAINNVFNNGHNGETYNIGTNTELTNNDLVSKIIQIFKNEFNYSDFNILHVDDRYGHDKRYSLNSDKIKNQLNWQSSYDFSKELKKYIMKILCK